MGYFLGKCRGMEWICRQVTSVPRKRIHRAAVLPGACRGLASQQLDPPGPERHWKEPKPQ